MRGVAKIFNGISMIGFVIIVVWFFQIDYKDLSLKQNTSAYLGIASMTMLIVALKLISRQINRKN